MKKMKRFLCAALVLVTLLSLLPLSAFAKAGDRLTGDEKLAYDALIPLIGQIASGERASTVITLGADLSGYPVDSVVNFKESSDSFNLSAIIDALTADHPYEMYWYGYSSGLSKRSYSNGTLAQVTFSFQVAANYQGSTANTVSPSKSAAGKAAAATAQAIVDANAGKNDYEKLLAYRDYICGAVTYNHTAANNNSFSSNSDPWQIIYVFDGNTSTNVVCEGYSKAFKYLCDLSTFSDPTFACYLVTGWMQGGTGAGGHMWNIVTLAGRNYMLDLTNTDTGTIGAGGELFLTGSTNTISNEFTLNYSNGTQQVVTRNGYRFPCAGGTYIDFYYDEETVALWDSSILTLANTSFEPVMLCDAYGHRYVGDSCSVCGSTLASHSGSCGTNVTWSLDENGKLTISGTGAMYDFGNIGVPWDPYCERIKTVEISGGITHIGEYAFQYCSNLSSISIPASVTSIGQRAFAFCSSLTGITLPAGITSINSGLFYGCTGLTSLTIPQNVTTIKDTAFIGCSGLTAITIPSKVTSIGDSAFMYCSNLATVNLPASVTKIGISAFHGCGDLSHVYYTGSKSKWSSMSVGANNSDLTNATIHYDWVARPAISKLENTAGGIKISWNAVAGAGQYRVYVKTSKGWATLGTTTGTSFLYTGAKSGLTYTFTIRCLNSAGNAYTSTYNTTGWRQTYVAQPTITRFQNTANGIQITWNAVAGAGKYRVFAKTSKGWMTLGTTTGTSFLYTGAKSGLTYTFTVRALNAAGTAFVSSFNASGWRQTYIAQPSISKFENVSNGIKITWNKVNGAAAYRVFAKTSKGWTAVGTTTGNSFVWTGAKSGLTYTFTVRCLNAKGNAYTSSYNTTGWRQKFIAQPTVTKLTNAAKGINVTWGAVSGAERYRVYVKTASGWSYIGTTTGTSFLWTGAKSGYAYTFTVRCVNKANTAFTSAFNTTGWSIKRT